MANGPVCVLCGEFLLSPAIMVGSLAFCDTICLSASDELARDRREVSEEEANAMAEEHAQVVAGKDQEHLDDMSDDGTDWDRAAHDADMDFFGSDEF